MARCGTITVVDPGDQDRPLLAVPVHLDPRLDPAIYAMRQGSAIYAFAAAVASALHPN